MNAKIHHYKSLVKNGQLEVMAPAGTTGKTLLLGQLGYRIRSPSVMMKLKIIDEMRESKFQLHTGEDFHSSLNPFSA